MSLTELHDGIEVTEFAARVPWLITRSDLFRYLPAHALTESAGGWPQLPFTLLGVTATFAFNFVTHPEGRLLEVAFSEPADETTDSTFRTNSAALSDRLGPPNAVDNPNHYHLMWRDSRVWIDYSAVVPERQGAERRHELSVYFHAGWPRAWFPDRERTLAEVKRLLGLMPGVEVVQIALTPIHTTLHLSVHSPISLARFAHIAGWANVGLRVGIDEYRQANGELTTDDPRGIIYRIEVSGPRGPEPEVHASNLQILGIHLADDLRKQGILGEDEARRLVKAFNNHTDFDGNALPRSEVIAQADDTTR